LIFAIKLASFPQPITALANNLDCSIQLTLTASFARDNICQLTLQMSAQMKLLCFVASLLLLAKPNGAGEGSSLTCIQEGKGWVFSE